MNNIWRIALGGIVSKPGRTSILALAVALGIALMISIRTAYMTVRDAQAPIHAGTEAGADWILEPSGGEPVPLTEETASAVQALPGVRSAILRESAFVKVNLDGTWQPGILFGTDPEREQQAGLLQLKAGMLPGNDVPGVAIRHQLARRLGLELGDKITVTRQGTSITLPVVGFLGPEGIGSASGSIGVTTTRSVMEKAGLSPSSGKILVKLENGINREQWLNEHRGFLRTAGLEPRVPVTYSHQSPVFTVLLIASFLGPAFSTILIQGSFAIVMRQREQEWQLWRIVGATRRQLRNLMLLEGVFIGVIGGLAGFAIGLVMARMIVRYLASLELLKYSPMEPVPLAIHPVTILFSLLFGVLVAVAASVRPILNEIRKPFGRTGVWPSSAPPSGGRFGLWLGGSACLAALSFLSGNRSICWPDLPVCYPCCLRFPASSMRFHARFRNLAVLAERSFHSASSGSGSMGLPRREAPGCCCSPLPSSSVSRPSTAHPGRTPGRRSPRKKPMCIFPAIWTRASCTGWRKSTGWKGSRPFSTWSL